MCLTPTITVIKNGISSIEIKTFCIFPHSLRHSSIFFIEQTHYFPFIYFFLRLSLFSFPTEMCVTTLSYHVFPKLLFDILMRHICILTFFSLLLSKFKICRVSTHATLIYRSVWRTAADLQAQGELHIIFAPNHSQAIPSVLQIIC